MLPAVPNVESRKVCRDFDTLICNTADVMSNSANVSRIQSDCCRGGLINKNMHMILVL